MKKHKPSPFGDEYELVPDTVGMITDSVWIKKDGSEMIVKFAWGGNLRHTPIPPYKQECEEHEEINCLCCATAP